ncbi:MAG: PepSY domain-containing protein, partial [Rhizomicrobium sp.]
GKAMFRCAYLALFFAVLAFAPPAAARVQAPPAVVEPRHPASSNYSIQPLDRILPAIRSSRPGRFFDAEGPFPDAAGGWHYRIKWLTPEGRVVWLDADARTGRVLGPYRGYARMALPPAGLRYYPFAGPRGFRGRFGVWRPGGWRGGRGRGGRRR